MESTQIQALYEPPLAAMPQLREKPRQGFETWKTAWKPGPNVPNFTVALGLRAVVVENGVRKTYSARYYNPNTGRFLSRDPEDGVAHDPKTLHKYLYAGGDPVNKVDPLGRLIVDEAYLDAQDAAEAKAVAATGERVVKILDCAAALLGAAIAYHEDSFWGSVAGGFGSGIACGIWLFL